MQRQLKQYKMNKAKIWLELKNAEKVAAAIKPSLEKHKIKTENNQLIIETESENLSLLRAYINTALRLAKLSSQVYD